mgnify:CR=1 FL=1
MAHFAEIDEKNIVLRVIVVDNKDITDEEGNEVEAIGVEFCEKLLGGTWLQTSYNDNFRANFAGIGGTYDLANDVFLDPKPYDDWILGDDFQWIPPLPRPDGELWFWDQQNSEWAELEEILDEEGNPCGMQRKQES